MARVDVKFAAEVAGDLYRRIGKVVLDFPGMRDLFRARLEAHQGAGIVRAKEIVGWLPDAVVEPLVAAVLDVVGNDNWNRLLLAHRAAQDLAGVKGFLAMVRSGDDSADVRVCFGLAFTAKFRDYAERHNL